MRINTKCSIALHLLMLMALKDDEQMVKRVIAMRGDGKLTSELMAESTGCNPVMVRNILGDLKKAGLVNVRRGTGGATLAATPEDISVWDVYRAVEKPSLKGFVGLHPNPSQKCPVGRNIYALLETPYEKMADAVEEAMENYTLAQLVAEYHRSFEPMARPG